MISIGYVVALSSIKLPLMQTHPFMCYPWLICLLGEQAYHLRFLNRSLSL